MDENEAELDLKTKGAKRLIIGHNTTGSEKWTSYHLQVGDVFLPPQVFLHLRTKRRQEVVGVHNDVHEGVNTADECAMASREVLGSAPRDEWHHGVVVNMQECHLTFVLAQHEEYGVQKLGDFGDKVHVHTTGFLKVKIRTQKGSNEMLKCSHIPGTPLESSNG